ncbi:MAG: hypothetical protein ABI787_08480 [Spartobacteria bacterium]
MHEEPDWLDQRLRDEQPYIDDAGFTAQIVSKLPAANSRRSYRAAFLLCITLLASVLTYFVSDGGRFLIVAFYQLAAMPLLFVGLVALGSALVLTAVAASAAWTQVRAER